jgi:hypothetical protein
MSAGELERFAFLTPKQAKMQGTSMATSLRGEDGKFCPKRPDDPTAQLVPFMCRGDQASGPGV